VKKMNQEPISKTMKYVATTIRAATMKRPRTTYFGDDSRLAEVKREALPSPQ